MRGLVLSRLPHRSPRGSPKGCPRAATCSRWGAGGSGSAPKRDTMARIVERLNRTWGDEGDPIVKARAVNAVSDVVAADAVTNTQISEHEQHQGGGARRRAPSQHRDQGAHVHDEQRAGQTLRSRPSTTPRRSSLWPSRFTTSSPPAKRYDIAELSAYLAEERIDARERTMWRSCSACAGCALSRQLRWRSTSGRRLQHVLPVVFAGPSPQDVSANAAGTCTATATRSIDGRSHPAPRRRRRSSRSSSLA